MRGTERHRGKFDDCSRCLHVGCVCEVCAMCVGWVHVCDCVGWVHVCDVCRLVHVCEMCRLGACVWRWR